MKPRLSLCATFQPWPLPVAPTFLFGRINCLPGQELQKGWVVLVQGGWAAATPSSGAEPVPAGVVFPRWAGKHYLGFSSVVHPRHGRCCKSHSHHPLLVSALQLLWWIHLFGLSIRNVTQIFEQGWVKAAANSGSRQAGAQILLRPHLTFGGWPPGFCSTASSIAFTLIS